MIFNLFLLVIGIFSIGAVMTVLFDLFGHWFGRGECKFERIYIKTNTKIVPSIPVSDQTIDGSCPSAWTKYPIGSTAIKKYVWISKRYGFSRKWGVWSTPELWAKY